MVYVDFSKRENKGLCDFIYETIKNQILDGSLPSDSKLPSKRALASHLGVSVITIQNAYNLLISEGYIYSIEKKGFFVTELVNRDAIFRGTLSSSESQAEKASEELKKSSVIDFSSNIPPVHKFPFSIWSHTMRQVLNSGDEKLLQRSGVKGVYELRKAISDHLREFRGMNVSPEQIVVSAGAESLYSLLVQFLGLNKVYAVEDPGYKKTKEIFRLNGAGCVSVKIDEQGISPQLLSLKNAQIVHISPNHHFPTGIVMPVRRRMELLSWLQEDGERLIIEDDYDSEFRFNGKPLPSLQSLAPQSRIIYMNTFSKTLSPSFRIGYMVLPEELVQAFEEKMKSCTCAVSSFEQFTLARFMSEGLYEKHINRMKNYYRTLRNSLISEIHKSGLIKVCEINEEEAGLHFIMKIRTQKTPQQLKKDIEKNGLKIPLLSDFSEDEELKNETAVVVNYSALTKEEMSLGVKKLYKAVTE